MSTKGTSCADCGHVEADHDWVRCGRWGCPCMKTDFSGRVIGRGFTPIDIPEEHEIAPALAVTTWTCPYPECGADNDVWGEGAVGSWMECGTCGKQAWLDMDRGVREALGLDAVAS